MWYNEGIVKDVGCEIYYTWLLATGTRRGLFILRETCCETIVMSFPQRFMWFLWKNDNFIAILLIPIGKPMTGVQLASEHKFKRNDKYAAQAGRAYALFFYGR
jgi:hypothetical protein